MELGRLNTHRNRTVPTRKTYITALVQRIGKRFNIGRKRRTFRAEGFTQESEGSGYWEEARCVTPLTTQHSSSQDDPEGESPGKSSPIDQLPPEILGQILLTFRGPIHLSGSIQADDNVTTIETISMVCSRWRQTVLWLPQLWSWLVLKYDCYSYLWSDTSLAKRVLQRVENALARVGNAPLTIELDFWLSDEDGEFPPEFHPVLDALCRRSGQWAELHVRAASIQFFEHPSLRLVKFTNLIGFSFDVYHHNSDEEVGKVLEIFSDCPALQSISMCTFLSPNTPLPWQQIQDMSIRLYPDSQPLLILRFLSQCPRLKSLSLDLYRLWSDSVGGDFEVVSSNVESLSLSSAEYLDFYSALFQRISFPKLSSLQISSSSTALRPLHLYAKPYVELQSDISALLELLFRSSPPITSLSINRLLLSNEHRLRLLELMPTLETLEITEPKDSWPYTENFICTSRFFSDLLLKYDRSSQSITDVLYPLGPLLPELQRLTLRVHRNGLDVERLFRAVRSRSHHVEGSARVSLNRLRSVEISLSRDSGFGFGDDEKFARLRSLADVRLEISLWDLPGY